MGEMLSDWMSPFFLTSRISLYDEADTINSVLKERDVKQIWHLMKASVRKQHLSYLHGKQFLPWLCFVFSKTYLCEFCFVENKFALIRVRKAYKSYQQSNLFYKYLTLLILKLWKAQKRSNNNWWKNIIWWKQHHLIDSHNFSSLIFFLVDEFIN